MAETFSRLFGRKPNYSTCSEEERGQIRKEFQHIFSYLSERNPSMNIPLASPDETLEELHHRLDQYSHLSFSTEECSGPWKKACKREI